MKALHLVHVVIARALNRFLLATINPMAPAWVLGPLVIRRGELDAKARRLLA